MSLSRSFGLESSGPGVLEQEEEEGGSEEDDMDDILSLLRGKQDKPGSDDVPHEGRKSIISGTSTSSDNGIANGEVGLELSASRKEFSAEKLHAKREIGITEKQLTSRSSLTSRVARPRSARNSKNTMGDFSPLENNGRDDAAGKGEGFLSHSSADRVVSSATYSPREGTKDKEETSTQDHGSPRSYRKHIPIPNIRDGNVLANKLEGQLKRFTQEVQSLIELQREEKENLFGQFEQREREMRDRIQNVDNHLKESQDAKLSDLEKKHRESIDLMGSRYDEMINRISSGQEETAAIHRTIKQMEAHSSAASARTDRECKRLDDLMQRNFIGQDNTESIIGDMRKALGDLNINCTEERERLNVLQASVERERIAFQAQQCEEKATLAQRWAVHESEKQYAEEESSRKRQQLDRETALLCKQRRELDVEKQDFLRQSKIEGDELLRKKDTLQKAEALFENRKKSVETELKEAEKRTSEFRGARSKLEEGMERMLELSEFATHKDDEATDKLRRAERLGADLRGVDSEVRRAEECVRARSEEIEEDRLRLVAERVAFLTERSEARRGVAEARRSFL